ncbi:tRNA (N(6)-L-threonylcarbamoyladenosine(37)-C(2))-methylthiotransferase MtaB [uncultured Clostridium sp.]|jgi:threonylcarbamoyladenosine tRNA methylthiotransferase MtaB|uniref:tRNA (N(6)-L-threonylcarbamoyladenosine(37)-C(2))- methylthiotransferase MtaB n=1 Tax=uncultured Clostridium sp. TaxID=59620 RepID=UPI002614654D|nr:tRNA (N(6)-L-threonylcarbamoyladenosine(37)-C(2))-methylthiotransferase MtaB [uncultured Clostridium sp.]
MKVAFSTLGCRVNKYESDAMIEKFVIEGYEVVEYSDIADVYVINTCSVTNMGDKKSRQLISKARRQNPESIIAAVGCYSQIAPTEVAAIEGVDVVLGTRNKGDIIYYVNKAKDEGKQQVKVGAVLRNKVFEEFDVKEYQGKIRAFLKIQDGCNRFCTYCIIPYTRGSLASKNPKRVIQEITKLAEDGFKEVVISGIHTASYGHDLEQSITLVDILEQIEGINGMERVRIGSIEPGFCSQENVERMINLKKLCPNFHLSLQSGCTETLKRMNRRYTAAEYEATVNMLREKFPTISITTDVIVGFPGETDAEFNETYEFLKRIKLTKMHIFKYSPRKGTKAATMENQIDGNIKEERSKKLIELNAQNEADFAKENIGREVEVLFESKNDGNVFSGYAENYLKVEVRGYENIVNQIQKVKIIGSENEIAIGELI